jgi:catechol 2,3-dioxygenase-like lactoylglutathione lyase family enzyme
MIELAATQVWVHDQDEALDFYTTKLGLELREDATLPEMGFRWLTVGPPGQPDVELVLMSIPGAPLDVARRAELEAHVATGMAGALFFAADDCYATCDELRARGVELTEEPQERPYGIDAAFRDPSGNHFRLTQTRELAST